MGKKESWFSAIKRAFTPHSKPESESKPRKEKKKGFGRRRRGEKNSFLPIFREPSSIEKILGEVERDHNLVFRPISPPVISPRPVSPPSVSPQPISPQPVSPRPVSPPPVSPRSVSPVPVSSRPDYARPVSRTAASQRVLSPTANTLQPVSPRRPVSLHPVSPLPVSPRPISPIPASANANAKPVSPTAASQRVLSPTPNTLQPVSPRPVSPHPVSPLPVSSRPISPIPVSSRTDYARPVSRTAASQRVLSPTANTLQPVSPRPVSPHPVSPRPISPILVSSRPDYVRPVSPTAASRRVLSPKANSLQPVSSRSDSQLPVSSGTVSSRPDYLKPVSPKANSQGSTSQGAHRPAAFSSRFVQRPKEITYRPEPTPGNQHASATKIQAAFRGYMARRNFRARKGMARLQEVVRGKHAKRQARNAMKHMQLLVRVQTQIQSRRINMLQNRHLENQSVLERLGTSEAGNGNWDGSVLTKEEKDAQLQRKVDAMIMRERSMAYAYSSQPLKSSPRSALSNSRSGAFPLWLHWVDRQLPVVNTPQPSQPQPTKHLLTPARDSHFPSNSSFKTPTPSSPIQTPSSSRSYTGMSRFSRGRTESRFKDDDDSLVSCPAFSARNYMIPTASARAKARERAVAADGSKRRLSYPMAKARNTGSLASGSPRESVRSLGNLSFISTASTTAARKPFNRFV